MEIQFQFNKIKIIWTWQARLFYNFYVTKFINVEKCKLWLCLRWFEKLYSLKITLNIIIEMKNETFIYYKNKFYLFYISIDEYNLLCCISVLLYNWSFLSSLIKTFLDSIWLLFNGLEIFEIFPAIKMLGFDIKNNVLAKMNLLSILRIKINNKYKKEGSISKRIIAIKNYWVMQMKRTR